MEGREALRIQDFKERTWSWSVISFGVKVVVKKKNARMHFKPSWRTITHCLLVEEWV